MKVKFRYEATTSRIETCSIEIPDEIVDGEAQVDYIAEHGEEAVLLDDGRSDESYDTIWETIEIVEDI